MWLITSILFISIHLTQETCVFDSGNYDISLLDSPSPWFLRVENGSNPVMFHISPCRPMTTFDTCKDASICRQDSSSPSTIGTAETPEFIKNSDDKGFWLVYSGDNPPDQGYRIQTAINFKCADKLGSPIFLHSTPFSYYFLWPTIAACKKTTEEKVERHEVRCYVYDDQGRKLDLSPLSLKTGYHNVKTIVSAIDFRINICADIDESGCNQTGACRKIGSEFINFGNPLTPLKLGPDGHVRLEYTVNETNPKIPSGCSEAPKTTIVFKCPHEVSVGHRFSQFMGPVLTSAIKCHYSIDWITEYACPAKELETTESCSLNLLERGIDIDLHPLKKLEADDPYHVRANTEDIYLNVCGGLPSSVCQDSSSAVCLKVSSTEDISLGSSNAKKLRFVEGQIILTYDQGSKCPDNPELTYSTVINFQCSSNDTDQLTFNYKTNCTYFFNWETKLACVDLATGFECQARHGSAVIDLSMLVKHEGTNGWTALTSNVAEYSNSDIILNVCGGVFIPEEFKGCAVGSAICLKTKNGDEKDKVISLGRYEDEPKFGDHKAHLLYKNGDVCHNNHDKKYSSIINFNCLHGKLDSSPSLTEISNDGCHFEFEWSTAAGCPQVVNTGDHCQVFNDELGLDLDLTPLQKLGTLKVSSEGSDFYLSVCGEAKEQLCDSLGKYAVCQVDNKGSVVSLGRPSSTLRYYDGFVNLTYTGGTPYHDEAAMQRRTTISFLCDSSAGNGHPVFVNEVDQIFNFKWYTSLVCPDEPTECVVVDEKRNEQYDLSSLTRVPGQSNWEAVTRDESPIKKFYINVCRPLVDAVPGCDQAASSCVVNLVNNKEIVSVSNAGRSRIRPTVETQGLLTLTFDSGKTCLESGTATNYRTIIHLSCNDNAKATEPHFFKSLGNCDYVFLWITSAACPVKAIESKENNCSITDESSGFVYSLQSLRDVYNVPLENDELKSIDVSICGAPINESCKSDKNVAACGKGTEDKVLASYNAAELEITTSNQIVIKYFGGYDKKNGKSKSSVEISLNCDQNVGKQMLTLDRHEDDVYYLSMDTPIACFQSEMSCVIWDADGNEYDLTSLRRDDTNWQVEDSRTKHNDLRYVVNVCRSLVSVGDLFMSNCTAGSAGCQVSHTGRSFSLGRAVEKPRVVSEGQVEVRYTGGTPCHGEQFNRSVRITFECSTIQKDPVFVDETPECEYLISWSTPAACPIRRAVGQNCYVEDKRFGHRYDLTELKKLGPQSITGGNHNYTISVCSSVECGSEQNVGVCQQVGDRKINGGLYNEELIYDDGGLTLVYNGGLSNCHRQYNRSSRIRFVCGSSVTGNPVFLEEWADCSYLFLWETSHACGITTTSSCSVYDDDGVLYDLSDLTLYNSNHVVDVDGDKYLINVCRSVTQNNDHGCDSTSGVCKVDSKKNSVNLGSVHHGPYFEDGFLKLKYTFGADCDSKTSEVVITFQCDKNELESEPVFLKMENCVWHFLWTTASACPQLSEPTTNTNDCTVINPDTGFKFDLTPLTNTDQITFEDEVKQHRYTINICRNITKSSCGDNIGGCQEEKKSEGRKWKTGIANSKLHFHNGVVFLNYTGGDKCHGGQYTRSTVIRFLCLPDSGVGKPFFMGESENCTYYVTWHTEFACEKRVHCMVDTGSSIIDLSPLMKTDHYQALQTKSSTDIYYLSVCRPLNPIPDHSCPPVSAACVSSKDGSSINLGQVANPPNIDDQGRVSISYYGGSPCPKNSRVQTSTKIFFVCREDSGTGSPNLIDVTDECEYIFEWITDLACSKNSSQKLTNLGKCVFSDPLTKATFDLRPLTKKPDTPLKVHGQDTVVNICGEMTGECSEAAFCRDKNIVLGSVNSVSAFSQENELRLSFSNGSECTTGGQATTWSSEVLFTCDWSAKLGAPVQVDEINCYVYYRWATSIVCSQSCVVLTKNSTPVDLRPLASLSRTWNTSDSNGNNYWINVCHELPKNLVGLTPDATVTMSTKAGITEILGVLSNQKLTFNESTNEVILTYTGSSTEACKTDQVPTVNIRFTCDKGFGKPRFIGKNEDTCVFTFDWRSWVACPPSKIEQQIYWSTGTVYDEELNLSMNFSKLFNQVYKPKETRGKVDYEYVISLKSNSKESCGTSGICQTSKGFERVIGLREKATMFRNGNLLVMEFKSESPCGRNPSRNASSVITFECGTGQPEFVYESQDCNYYFTWQTEAVCFGNMILGSPSNHQDSHHSEGLSTGAIFGIVGVILLLVVALIFVFRDPSRREAVAYRCRQIWHQARRSPSYRYSRLSTNDYDNPERAQLLFKQEDGVIQVFSDDSDDEVLEL